MLKMIMIFFKVGFISFGGGWSTVGIFREEIVNNGLLSLEKFNEVVSIAQMTPGPVAVNVATYVGYSAYGFIGGLLNTIFLILPPIILFYIGLFILKKINVNRKNLLNSLKLGTVLLISFSLISLTETVFLNKEYSTFIISAISFIFFIFTKIDPIYIILASAFSAIFILK